MVLRNEQVDLLITDIHLSGDMTGIQLLREVCQSVQWQSIPTFAISGLTSDDALKEFYRIGVRDFMQKPLDIELFQLKIKSLLRERLTYLKLEEEREKLKQLAFRDIMTGLHNRTYLKENFDDWSSQHSEFGVLLIDIDDLKPINDELGHDVGDQVIEAVGNALQENTTAGDLSIRLGGDEFLLFTENADENHLEAIGKKLISTLNKTSYAGHSGINVSIGADICRSERSLKDTLKLVDAVLYHAKLDGKNRVDVSWH